MNIIYLKDGAQLNCPEPPYGPEVKFKQDHMGLKHAVCNK